DYLKKYLPSILAVTAKDVQRVAKEYLQPDSRVVVWSLPGKEKAGAEKVAPPDKRKANRALAADNPGTFSLKDAKRVELPNGLVLLLFENHRVPVVFAEAAVQNVHLYEPEDKVGVAELTGSLL